VLSARRFAARPVGAHSATSTDLARRILSSELTSVVLPTPGAAGDDHHLGPERDPDRFPLAVGERQPGALFDPRNRLVGVDRRPGRLTLGERLQPLPDIALGLVQRGEKGAAPALELIRNDMAGGDLLGERGLDQACGHLQERLGQRHQLRDRQPAMPLIHRLGEGMRNAGAYPNHRGLLDAEPHRDLVGALEADAADVAGEPVRVLRDQPNRVGAVNLVDAHRPRGADPVVVQEHPHH
jgi:hypothetical protein